MKARVFFLFIGTALADPGTQPHELDNTNPPESTEARCHPCHSGGTDDDGKYFRPWDTWAGTMMAQAARDPLYLAALAVAEKDSPGIGNVCWRCHSPQGWVKGNASGLGTMLDNDDLEGIACDACHRSFDPSKSMPVVDPKGPYVGQGYLFWDPAITKHGPYSDADSPAHTTVADPFTSSPRLCGQCHELSNPKVTMKDSKGADTGIPFPLDTTYTEWASYAKNAGSKTCIECHMRQATGDLQVSTFASAKTRTKPRTHFFAAANVWGIDTVRKTYPELDSMRTLAFDAAKTEAMATLQSAVTVDLKAQAMATAGDMISVVVRVTNNTGHKFPTGYADGRRATLRVTLGSTSVDARVYECKQARFSDKKEWHIAANDTFLSDTRLPPKGFVVDARTPVIGAMFGDGFDEQTVMLAVPGFEAGTLAITATVFYQATVKEMLDELGSKLDPGQPIAIASASSSLAVSAAPPTPMPMMPKTTSGCSCNQAPASGDWMPIALFLTVCSRSFSRSRDRRSRSSIQPRTARSLPGSRT